MSPVDDEDDDEDADDVLFYLGRNDFEVHVNGELVYTKRGTGHFPDLDLVVEEVRAVLLLLLLMMMMSKKPLPFSQLSAHLSIGMKTKVVQHVPMIIFTDLHKRFFLTPPAF